MSIKSQPNKWIESFHQATTAVPRMIINQQTLIFDDDDLVKSFTTTEEGVVFFAIINLPNFTNSITATFSIENSNGDDIYSKASLAKNSKTKINICSDGNDVPLVGTSTIKLTLSSAAGGSGGTAKVTLYIV